MSTGLDYAAEIVKRARLARGLSLVAMAEEAGISDKTINRLELSQTTPKPGLQQRFETYFGWEPGLLTKIIESDTPWKIANMDDLVGELPESQLSDQTLLWEITHRLQSKDERIQHLEERIRELEAELEHYRE